jgi:hypothetical protein
MSMPLILVAPGLLALPPQMLAACASLGRIAQLARAPRLAPLGLTAALVDALGAPASTPTAPLAALGAGADPGAHYIAMADPVYLVAGRDDLVLAARVEDLGADANALAATLDTHLAADGARLVAARPDTWFVRTARAYDVVTTPIDAALGHGVFPHLPQGAGAVTWKRWLTEAQMLLHEHPVNVAREARGRLTANGVWFWGGGTLANAGQLPAIAVTAPQRPLGDLARGIAHHAGGSIAALSRDETADGALSRAAARAHELAVVIQDAIASESDLAHFDAHWLAPALEQLARGTVASVELIADGNGVAARWIARPTTLVQRLLARRVGPFAAPARA